MLDTPPAPAWLTRPTDVNALDPALWPDSMVRELDGDVAVGGVTVTSLLEQHGSPLWVLDKGTVVAQARRIRDALSDAFAPLGVRTQINYASKALLTAELLRWLVAEGLNVDVSTGGELGLALAAGIPGERLELHGNNKSDAELDAAISSGVGLVIIDSAEEVDRVAAVAARHRVRQRVLLRVVTGVSAHTHEFLRTAGFDQKFGVPETDLPSAVQRLRAAEEAGTLEFVGLHSHIGSQIFDTAGFSDAIDVLCGVLAEISPSRGLPLLNLGGGFGISYTPEDDPTPIATIMTGFADALARASRAHGIPVPSVSLEPGRFIVGRAGITLYEVGAIKDVPVDETGVTRRRYVAVDGGMSDNPRPELYQAQYSVVLASRASDAPPVLCRVVGKHCETGDIVVHDCYLPEDVRRGDILAVAATGAYTFALSSNYNMVSRPAVVAVAHGQSSVLIRAETLDDLVARDAGVHGPAQA